MTGEFVMLHTRTELSETIYLNYCGIAFAHMEWALSAHCPSATYEQVKCRMGSSPGKAADKRKVSVRLAKENIDS